MRCHNQQAHTWHWCCFVQGKTIDFAVANINKPLYPAVDGSWYSLEGRGTRPQRQLDAAPPHLQGQLVEQGRVQICCPSKRKGPCLGLVEPLKGLLQVVVVRAVDLRTGRRPFLPEAWWLEVSVGGATNASELHVAFRTRCCRFYHGCSRRH